MFSRLRATIDRTISEEQARQQKALDDQKSSASNSSQRNGSRARASSGTGTQSPARKARSAKKASEDLNLEGVAANPDPAFFEAAFVIDEPDETGTPARIATPVSADKKMNNNTPPKDAEAPADSSKDSTESQQNGGKGDQVNVDSVLSEKSASTAPSGANELSPEVRARLRKLDKLEKAYPELLRSYRIAHARVAAIEPFETALKENTPLTSIREPDALVEYLNQLKLKGDMVMDELKRVTGEKDTHKKKADEAEKELTALKEEVVALKAASAESPAVDADAAVNATEEPKTTTEGQHSSTPSAAKSPVSRVIGVFSPKQKPAEPTESKDGQEFFSYEDELPQLQAEVEKKSEEIQKLTTEVLNLKEELSVAKEHSTGLSESLEIANRALSESRDAFAVKKFVETQLEARKAEITTLTERLNKTQSRLKELEAQLETQKTDANAALEEKSTELTTYMSRNDALEAHVKILADAKSATIDRLTSEIKELTKTKADYEAKIGQLEKKLESTPIPPAPLASTATPLDNSLAPPASTGSKKKNKKKKKGGASAAPAAPEHTPSEVSVGMEPLPSPAETSASGELQLEVDRLREEVAKKDQRIENLSKQRKTEEDLREEIVNLQENLMVIGDDHVQAKDRIKHLEAEKTALKQRISELEKELESSASSAKTNTKLQREYESLKQEFDDLKLKSSTLQSDLAAAQQLAQTRYKDLTDLRGVVQTVQPELKSLRQESATLKTTKEELATKNTELRNLEKREKELKTELTRAQRLASDREAEIKSLHEKVTQETNARLRLEDDKRVAGRDLRRSEAEKIELSAKEEKATRELQRVQEEASKLRPRIKQLEDEVAQLKKEQEVLREETELKTSQYASVQKVLGSMRDQMAEVNIQLKESQAQCESLDEELAEARRMLGERTRETETMRGLLADVDKRAEDKVHEMRAKMEAAVEERDRIEDESSALARRKARETEELRQKIRDLEREVKALVSEKDDLEDKERTLRKRKEDLEAYEERAGSEMNEMRSAVSNLQTTLDASEQQVRDMEKKNGELRKTLDELRSRYDKATKELKAVQGKLTASSSSSAVASRGSMESTRSGSTVLGAGANNGQQPTTGVDKVYLKTVLLQFLEQRDNKLRMQLVPVLGQLLGFNKGDLEKWLAATQHLGAK